MTLFDLAVVAIFAIYAVLGYATGLVRRVLGLVVVYLGAVVATFMGPQAGAIYQQAVPSTSTPDARVYGWLAAFFFLLVVVEIMATLVHESLQVSVIAFNHFSGALVGVITAGALTVVLFFMLAGYSQPLGAGGLDAQQLKVRDALTSSRVGFPIARTFGPYVIPLMQGALPREPKEYFGSSTL